MLTRQVLMRSCVVFCLGGLGFSVYNLHRQTQLQTELRDLQIFMGQLEYQRDEALAQAEVWRMLAVQRGRRCGPPEQDL